MALYNQHPHWPAVVATCRTLKDQGFEVLLAGGCVRDMIMQRVPNDFDLATNALPDEVTRLFPKSLTVGREFGVIILPFADFQIEIATFRKDGPYLDGRRPSSVEFSSAQEDANRRDFTVNALFYDLDSQSIQDFVGGKLDIQRKLIRTVGEASKRFEEDKLRIMRAIRFAAQLGFTIDGETWQAITSMASQITAVSHERIRDELIKLLKARDCSRGLILLRKSALLNKIAPEWYNKLKSCPKLWSLALRISKNRKNSRAEEPVLVLGLFIGSGLLAKHQSEALAESKWIQNLLKRLKFSNDLTAQVAWGIQNAKLVQTIGNEPTAKQIRALGHINFCSLEAALSSFETATANRQSNLQPTYAQLRDQAKTKFLVNGKLPARFITGDDLIHLGVKPGTQFGELLEQSYDDQLTQKIQTKAEALNHVKAQLKQS